MNADVSTFVRPASWRSTLASLVAATSLLAACGGGDGGDASGYTRLVVFGDSLSDVGTYATPGVQQLGGGKYTINGAGAKIWVDLLAERTGVAAPCAARVGLEASASLAGLAAPITDVDGCYGYAQGGSRVTNPIGVANKALLGLGDPSGALGQLTNPVTEQVQRHFARAGAFVASDLVTVLAGANDVFMNLATVNAVAAGGGDASAAAAAAVDAMSDAGTELAEIVRGQLLPNGARRVIVVAVPDITKTPFGATLPASSVALVQQMTQAFNSSLGNGVAAAAGVLWVDGYTTSQAIAAKPQDYGIANNTGVACDPGATPLGSLTCSATTLIPGVNTSGYQFADSVHPTPLGHRVFADAVFERMRSAGWL
jgi:phospholipase/lecithinase/hemolysin